MSLTRRGDAAGQSTQPVYKSRVPGYVRFAKSPLDPLCFNYEEALQFLCSPIVTDDRGKKGLSAQPVFLVDPCQAGLSPLKTATIYPSANSNQAYLGTFPGRFFFTYGTPGATSAGLIGTGPFAEPMGYYGSQTSAVTTAQFIIIDTRGLHDTLSLNMQCNSASTAAVSVNVTTDTAAQGSAFPAQTAGVWTNGNLTLDSVAAALTIAKQYDITHLATTIALNPLSFRWIAIVVAAAGAGTTTLNYALK